MNRDNSVIWYVISLGMSMSYLTCKRDSIYDKSGAYSCCGSIIVYMAGGGYWF